MKNKLVRKCLPIVCLLTTSLYANLVFSGWSDDQSQRSYNQRFGAFPPLDIDQRLQESLRQQEGMSTEKPAEESLPRYNSATDFDSSYQSVTYPEQEYPVQKSQQQNNLNYDRSRSVSSHSSSPRKKRSGSPQKKRGSSFSGPWDSKGSGFSMPWGNNGSGFNSPWDSKGSGFNAPWNNRRSNFSGPWDSNGSDFSMPWGNNGSGFDPWGNR